MMRINLNTNNKKKLLGKCFVANQTQDKNNMYYLNSNLNLQILEINKNKPYITHEKLRLSNINK